VRFDDAIISKESGGETHDDAWDFFSEDTVNNNLVSVQLISEDDLTGETAINSPVITPVPDEAEAPF